MTPSEIRTYLRTVGSNGLRYFPYLVARELSDLSAILLYDLQRRQSGRKPLIRDGRNWTFDSSRALAVKHPYASEEGIRKALVRLEDEGLLFIEKSGKYNRRKYDKKWWYFVPAGVLVRARARRMRYNPTIAAALDIPKAVLIENFRHQRQELGADDFVTMDPDDIDIPYSSKTVGRHLHALVEESLLERDPKDNHRYRVPEEETREPEWREQREPIAVAPKLLLPTLKHGQIGLLVGHSGTGKTSYATFVALQNASSGKKVLYVSLEEPGVNISHRMYAQEFHIDYALLHRGDAGAFEELEARFNALGGGRSVLNSCRIIDLSGEHLTPVRLNRAITEEIESGFAPDLVLIDQLEYIIPETDPTTDDDEVEPEELTRANLAANAVRESIPVGQFETWVLHQVIGALTENYAVDSVSGGEAVTDKFDAVVGLGRQTNASNELRVFSLTSQAQLERTFETDFPHMRFKLKEE